MRECGLGENMIWWIIIFSYLASALVAARLLYPKIIARARKDHGYPDSSYALSDGFYIFCALYLGIFWPLVLAVVFGYLVIGKFIIRFIQGSLRRVKT